MSPDVPAIKERHAELEAALLNQIQQALPPAELCTADEGLRRHPPEPALIRQGAPLCAIVLALDDRALGATQMLRRNLGMRATRIGQRLEQRPRRVCEHPDRPLKAGEAQSKAYGSGANRP